MRNNPFARKVAPRQRAAGGFGRARETGPREETAAETERLATAAQGDAAADLLEAERPAEQPPAPADSPVDRLADFLESEIKRHFTPEEVRMSQRDDLAVHVEEFVREAAGEQKIEISDAEVCDLATYLLNDLIESVGVEEDPLIAEPANPSTDSVFDAKERIQPLLMEHIDPQAASELPRTELADQVGDVVGELLVQEKIHLNLKEQRDLVTLLLNDMLGLGPLEPLLADDTVSDIMVNGPNQVYIERGGKLELTDVRFRDDRHLLNIAQRIVNAVGRRVDETSPICDARLLDGSRVNVIIPPLAIDGASISIRKFSKKKITLDKMITFGSLSPRVAQLLKIAGACRLNILISGGTGSGKTTMLNAISRLIDRGERIVTIEDAAELQLQQPHVVRLETRPPNLEGKGEITMRDLVKNALRMRPDRIILGEVRGGEAIDMLQAMNTGHDGSMGTIHANRPREALTRLENMVNMAGLNLPPKAIREQIAGALDLIVQVSRMRDGGRRTVYVTEVVGMEGEVITTQDLFRFEWKGQDESGKLVGDWVSAGVRPHFMPRAEYFGLGRTLMQVMS
ncbi:MAG: CpaF family protein [Rhodothalassiaceae bacterium]